MEQIKKIEDIIIGLKGSTEALTIYYNYHKTDETSLSQQLKIAAMHSDDVNYNKFSSAWDSEAERQQASDSDTVWTMESVAPWSMRIKVQKNSLSLSNLLTIKNFKNPQLLDFCGALEREISKMLAPDGSILSISLNDNREERPWANINKFSKWVGPISLQDVAEDEQIWTLIISNAQKNSYRSFSSNKLTFIIEHLELFPALEKYLLSSKLENASNKNSANKDGVLKL